MGREPEAEAAAKFASPRKVEDRCTNLFANVCIVRPSRCLWIPARIAAVLICAIFFLPSSGAASSGKDDLLKQSKEAFDRDDYDLAIARLSDAIKIDSNDAQLWSRRCLAYERKGDFQRAFADCDTAVRLAPLSAKAHRQRGDVFYRTGKIDQALADIEEAVKLDPQDGKNYLERGMVRNFRRQYDLAVADFDEAIRLDPKNSDAFALRANLLFRKHDYDGARDDYNKAIELDPKNAFAYTSRGYASAAFLDYDDAIKDYNSAIAIDPGYEPARLYRAKVYAYKRSIRVGYFNLVLLGLGILALVIGAWRAFWSPTAFRHTVDRHFQLMADGRLAFYWGRKGLGYVVPDAASEERLRDFVRRFQSLSMIFGVAFVGLCFALAPLLVPVIEMISATTGVSTLNASLVASGAVLGLCVAGVILATWRWRRAVTRGLANARERFPRPTRDQWMADLIGDMPVWARRAVFGAYAWFLAIGIVQFWQVGLAHSVRCSTAASGSLSTWCPRV
jgi:tetratricopeptide (TPR) repeat protein